MKNSTRHSGPLMIPRKEFARQVKDVLAHLYDPIHLQTHPLTDLLAPDALSRSGPRGRILRQIIVAAIDSLKPEATVPFGAREWLGYRILYCRYIEGMTPQEASRELAISEGYLYQQQQQAIEAIVSLLWDRFVQQMEREANREPAGENLDLATQRRRIDLAPLIRGITATIEPLAAERGTHIQIRLSPDLTPVYADRVMARQAVLHILTYLLKRTEGEAITMTASVAGNEGIIAIHSPDLSVGKVSPEDHDESLARARRLTEAQGGRIWIEHGPGEAITACIAFPTVRPTTVLVVDDDRDTVNLIQRCLAQEAYRVVVAYSGEEARQLLHQIKPDLITLDVMMPDQDGWEVLQALRAEANGQNVPILICSVVNEPDLAMALGAQGFLAKPFRQETLLEKLEEVLQQADSVAIATPEQPSSSQ